MSTLALVPTPRRLERLPDQWVVPESPTVWCEPPAAEALFREVWAAPGLVSTRPAGSPQDADILLTIGSEGLPAEGYTLRIDDTGICLRATDEAGLIWGIQTLRQLALTQGGDPAPGRDPEPGSSTVTAQLSLRVLPALIIEDWPSLPWRGALLDVARWYQPVPFLKKFIDLLSLHKLNVLHLHLTDDQGWRLEVAKYPRLTEVGAWRHESQVGHWKYGTGDGIPHGGWYSQAELRDLVAYAAARAVQIVPEVDAPGHMQAAIAAYPLLGNDPAVRHRVGTRWGVIPHVLNVEESTVEFVCDVLDEVVDIFPGRYVHIGGDECPKDEWRGSARVQTLMRERGCADEDALQSWFIGRLVAHLDSRGRSAVGWDEIREGGIPSGAAVMSWRGTFGGIEAALAGHEVVMAPNTHAYLDQYQSANLLTEPIAADGVIDLRQTYSLEIVPPELPRSARRRILGAECALWCEHIPTTIHAEYMAFPRLLAFSEVAWGTTGSYREFRRRVGAYLPALDRLGVNYRPLH